MERITMSQQKRDRLVREMMEELATVGDAGGVHGLRGRASNRKLPETIQA